MAKPKSNEDSVRLLESYKNALIAWNNGLEQLSDGTSVRSYINRNTPIVQKLVQRAGRGQTMTVTPPRMFGGPVMGPVDPFLCIFTAPHGLNVVPVICDMIDQTIGVIISGELLPEGSLEGSAGKARRKPSSTKVFVVHGRDNEAKQTVARFLEKLGLEPVILHERTNRGLTIIEKFEKHSDVIYAVVLMTPDDVGALGQDKDTLRCRARQNVVLELGYFMGRLGRDRVCVLVKGDVERPSDSDGIIYVPFDPNDGWRIALAKELREAGLNIDLNKAV